MSTLTPQTIQVVAVHSSLKFLLTRLYKTAKESPSDDLIFEENDLFDFGVKFKLRRLQISSGEIKLVLQVSIPGWKEIQEVASDQLRALYRDAFSLNCDCKEAVSAYDFEIYIEHAVKHFDSLEACALSLSQIRVQAAGAPILQALERIASEEAKEGMTPEVVHKLETHLRCGTCHCISTSEKTLVIFVVDFKEEMERALARLFLQQFSVAQKQVFQSPHCEFRRPNEPPKEILNIVGLGSPKSKLVGYVSFTFFPSHVRTEERRRKAVELMVNLLPYLDRHVKSTKSYMHTRMRTKKNDLLVELKEEQPGRGVGKHGAIAKGKTEKMRFVAGRAPSQVQSHC